jgi:integrator complex subunit 11
MYRTLSQGPIFMTHATKALSSIILKNDIWGNKSTVGHGSQNINVEARDVDACMEQVTCISPYQSIQVDDGLWIKAFPAGHCLGAVMFAAGMTVLDGSRTRTDSIPQVLYTGDYNMTSEFLLSPTHVDEVVACCKGVHCVISESTFGNTGVACLALPCLALPCLVLSCLVLSCLVSSCLV